MSEQEALEAYRQGRIGQLTLFRTLVRGGLSAAAALAVAVGVVVVAQRRVDPHPRARGGAGRPLTVGPAR